METDRKFEIVKREVNGIVDNLRKGESTIGLPYYQVKFAGESLLNQSKEEQMKEKGPEEISRDAELVLEALGISIGDFKELSNEFEERLQEETTQMTPPPHIQKNDQWSEEWNAQREKIIENSNKRMQNS